MFFGAGVYVGGGFYGDGVGVHGVNIIIAISGVKTAKITRAIPASIQNTSFPIGSICLVVIGVL